MGRKGLLALGAAVVLVVLLAIAVAASRGHATKQPKLSTPRVLQGEGNYADMMRRVERTKHVNGVK